MTGRSVEPLKQGEDPPGGWTNAGCHDGQWTMMAITYVNKEFITNWKKDEVGDMAVWS